MSKKKKPFRQSHTRKLRDTRIEGEPGYERKLASEIIKRWNAYNLGENSKPKHFDRRDISGIHRVRGENKKLALKKGLPTEYKYLCFGNRGLNEKIQI